MLEKTLSDKIKVISFVATIMVVYRHAFTISAFFENGTVPSTYNRIIHRVIASMTEVAVPVFFIISGYFFFRLSYLKAGQYGRMIKKKFFSLFIPFCFWNLMGLIVVALYNPQDIPSSSLNILEYFFLSEPYGPLWYVRDLLLLMVMVPLYQWAFDSRFKLVPVYLMIATLFYLWIPVSTNLLNEESILFFLFGGLVSKYSSTLLFHFSKKQTFFLVAFWLIVCFSINLWHFEWLHKLTTLWGITAFWACLDCIDNRMKNICVRLSPYSFFIYVTHFYVVKTIKILLSRIAPGNDLISMFTFLFAPLFTILVLIYLSRFLEKKAPNFYSIVMGGRTS